jgi:hypothetical protein
LTATGVPVPTLKTLPIAVDWAAVTKASATSETNVKSRDWVPSPTTV